MASGEEEEIGASPPQRPLPWVANLEMITDTFEFMVHQEYSRLPLDCLVDLSLQAHPKSDDGRVTERSQLALDHAASPILVINPPCNEHFISIPT